MRGSMIDFWDAVIAPYLQRAKPLMVVLAGAGDGTIAHRLLDATSAWGGTLHVIDQAPLFDEGSLRQHGSDRVVIHKGRVPDALGLLPVADLLLLDIDPNWYTVQSVLSAAATQCTRTRRQFPVALLTNTAWPYARRDCYVSPAAIPENFRQQHETAGIRPGQSGLCASRGLFADRIHAAAEYGPRNGVLTALEDFAAAETGRICHVTVPFLNGISMIHDAAAGSDAVRALREALDIGSAARALAEAVDLQRNGLAIEIGDLRRELAAKEYLAELLRETLRRERQAHAARCEPGAAPQAAPIFARQLAAARRKASTAVRLAVWAARGEIGARRIEQQASDTKAADIARLIESPIFDAAWYLKTYGDVAEAGTDPVEHFYHHGAAEQRDPGPLFSTGFYLDRYHDVAEAGVNPLLHYLQTGAREGRDPSPFFNTCYYLEQAKDAVEADKNPLEHYITTGLREGRRPAPPA